jgi:hypothetical protein
MSASFEVQTPAQAAVTAEFEATQVTEPSSPAPGLHLVPSLDDSPDAKDTNVDASNAGDLPLIRQLLAAYAAGEIEPEPVTLGPLPVGASRQMRAIADHFALWVGLRAADGIFAPVPYSTTVPVDAGIVPRKSSASFLLRQMCACVVIKHVGDLPKRGKGSGTKLFVPGTWQPADPAARAVIAETGRHEQAADLVWVPIETLGLDGAIS